MSNLPPPPIVGTIVDARKNSDGTLWHVVVDTEDGRVAFAVNAVPISDEMRDAIEKYRAENSVGPEE